MNQAFTRLPLPLKLLLIALVPLCFMLYATYQVYMEKARNITELKNFISRSNQSADLTRLIDQLQRERKYTLNFSQKPAPGKRKTSGFDDKKPIFGLVHINASAFLGALRLSGFTLWV